MAQKALTSICRTRLNRYCSRATRGAVWANDGARMCQPSRVFHLLADAGGRRERARLLGLPFFRTPESRSSRCAPLACPCSCRAAVASPLTPSFRMRLASRSRSGPPAALGLAPSLCGQRATRVHSAYERTRRDLPWCGTLLILRVRVRRFVGCTPQCPRRIFAERFPDLANPRARLTERLRAARQHVGRALGGRAGAHLAERLGMRASSKTVRQLVRASPLPCADPPVCRPPGCPGHRQLVVAARPLLRHAPARSWATWSAIDS